MKKKSILSNGKIVGFFLSDHIKPTFPWLGRKLTISW